MYVHHFCFFHLSCGNAVVYNVCVFHFILKSLHFCKEFFENMTHISHHKYISYEINIFHPVTRYKKHRLKGPQQGQSSKYLSGLKLFHPFKFRIDVLAWKSKNRREISVATIIVCSNRKLYFWKSCICINIFVNYLENTKVNIKMQLTNILYSKNGLSVIKTKWVKCFSMVY